MPASGTKYEKPVWICATFNMKGKDACASQQIPEAILLEKTREVLRDSLPEKTLAEVDRDELSNLREYVTQIIVPRHQPAGLCIDGWARSSGYLGESLPQPELDAGNAGAGPAKAIGTGSTQKRGGK